MTDKEFEKIWEQVVKADTKPNIIEDFGFWFMRGEREGERS